MTVEPAQTTPYPSRSCGSTGNEMMEFMYKEAAQNPSRHCFVVIHNIDGPGAYVYVCGCVCFFVV
jgi:hypothetical protein